MADVDFVAVEVELVPHTIKQESDLGPVDVFVNQYKIRARLPGSKFQWVGYVGSHKNAPVLFTRQRNGREWPEAIKEAVRDGVADAIGRGVRKEVQPPEPTDIEDEDNDDELDEEE